MAGRDVAGVGAWARRSPEIVDKILVGLCALIWLVLLGFGVAAVVALVDLGRGFHEPAENPHTGLLYVIIGVSALIILVAIPVLLRVRQAEQAGRPAGAAAPRAGTASARPGQRLPPIGSDARAGAGRAVAAPRPASHDELVDRVLLRGISELASAIGIALIAVAAATYLMALGKETGAWVGYGVAGLITVLMPAIPWLQVRQLDALS